MVVEEYPVFREGVSEERKIAELKEQGCVIREIRRNVTVHRGEGVTEIGDMIVVERPTN